MAISRRIGVAIGVTAGLATAVLMGQGGVTPGPMGLQTVGPGLVKNGIKVELKPCSANEVLIPLAADAGYACSPITSLETDPKVYTQSGPGHYCKGDGTGVECEYDLAPLAESMSADAGLYVQSVFTKAITVGDDGFTATKIKKYTFNVSAGTRGGGSCGAPEAIGLDGGYSPSGWPCFATASSELAANGLYPQCTVAELGGPGTASVYLYLCCAKATNCVTGTSEVVTATVFFP